MRTGWNPLLSFLLEFYVDEGRGAGIRTQDLLHPIQQQVCPQRNTASIVSTVSILFHSGCANVPPRKATRNNINHRSSGKGELTVIILHGGYGAQN